MTARRSWYVQDDFKPVATLDRAACEAAMAVKEYELRGRRYHLACLPSARP